jgi:Rps23 Pro-64 3,4-dihydroxylase Tpa1-like proline 4-hydroxylase
MLKITKSFTHNISIYDDFLHDEKLINELKIESFQEKIVSGENHFNLTPSQKVIYKLAEAAVMHYCFENDINYSNLEFNNFQKGYLKKYDESMVSAHLYEPHHDIAEGGYITALYYIDSDYSEDKWVGGELAIYEKLSFVDYPGNIINVLPKPNRLVIFPGFLVHRVKPYFGEKPRTSIVMGWGVEDSVKNNSVII